MGGDCLSNLLILAGDRAALLGANGLLQGLGLGSGSLMFIRTPEILLSAEHAADPWGQDAARNAPGPRVLLVLVVWNNAAAGDLFDDPDKAVDEDVTAYTTDEAIGNRVGEGHECEGDEGGNGITHVPPVNLGDGADHHGSHENQHAAGGPRGDGSEDGSEEDGDEEADTGDHGSQTGLASLGNTGTGLDEGGDRGCTEEGTNGDAKGIDHVSDG